MVTVSLVSGRAKTRLRKAYVAAQSEGLHEPTTGPRQSVAAAGLGALWMD
jgi:hypothetical protein